MQNPPKQRGILPVRATGQSIRLTPPCKSLESYFANAPQTKLLHALTPSTEQLKEARTSLHNTNHFTRKIKLPLMQLYCLANKDSDGIQGP